MCDFQSQFNLLVFPTLESYSHNVFFADEDNMWNKITFFDQM
jgi:hypothetical protein